MEPKRLNVRVNRHVLGERVSSLTTSSHSRPQYHLILWPNKSLPQIKTKWCSRYLKFYSNALNFEDTFHSQLIASKVLHFSEPWNESFSRFFQFCVRHVILLSFHFYCKYPFILRHTEIWSMFHYDSSNKGELYWRCN